MSENLLSVSPIPVRTLRNGFALPVLGLGTWLMGGDTVVDPTADLAREVAALQAGLALGFRHIDTAEIYSKGVAETIVATAIKDFPRADLILASKVSTPNHDYDDLLKSLKGSLERLQTPYLDIYYLHAPNLEVPLAETARALNVAHRDGLIRHIAVSNFLPERLDALQAYLDSPIVVNQVHYNLAFREAEAVGMFDHAVKHDYFVEAWSPLRLKKRNVDNALASKNVWERGVYPVLDAVANSNGKTNVQIALNWVVSHPQTITLIKSSSPAHLREAVGACDWSLSTTDAEILTRDFQPQFVVSDSIPLK